LRPVGTGAEREARKRLAREREVVARQLQKRLDNLVSIAYSDDITKNGDTETVPAALKTSGSLAEETETFVMVETVQTPAIVGDTIGGPEDIARLDAMEKAVKSNLPIALLTSADRTAARKRMREALYDLWQTDLWRLRKQKNGMEYDSFRVYAAERLKVTPSRISQLIGAEHEDRVAAINSGVEGIAILTATQFSPRAGGTRGPRSVGANETAAVILRGLEHWQNDSGERIRAISDEDAGAVEALASAHKAAVASLADYRTLLAQYANQAAAAQAKAKAEREEAKAKRESAKADKEQARLALNVENIKKAG